MTDKVSRKIVKPTQRTEHSHHRFACATWRLSKNRFLTGMAHPPHSTKGRGKRSPWTAQHLAAAVFLTSPTSTSTMWPRSACRRSSTANDRSRASTPNPWSQVIAPHEWRRHQEGRSNSKKGAAMQRDGSRSRKGSTAKNAVRDLLASLEAPRTEEVRRVRSSF